MEDPLKILGIPKGSSLEEAKSSYKSLSLKYHPDKNPNPDAHKIFISIKNAYDTILKNPYLLNIFSNDAINKDRHKQKGASLSVDLTISAEDFYFSDKKTISIKKLITCKTCKGTGSEDLIVHTCSLCDGNGSVSNEILEFLEKDSSCPICQGLGILPLDLCPTCHGEAVVSSAVRETINIDHSNLSSNVFLKEKGNDGKFGGLPGDLTINFLIKEKFFYFKNKTLNTDLEVSPVQFMVGGELSFNVNKTAINFVMDNKSLSQQVFVLEKPVTVHYKIKIPELLDQNKSLYSKILKNEKAAGVVSKQVHRH